MNAIIGAVIAALIAIATGSIALLTGPNIESFGDISTIQWAVLCIGGGLTFLKDWQAITARRAINKVTNSGDGGGLI